MQPITLSTRYKLEGIRPCICDSVEIRTQDPQFRRLLLYPTELRNQLNRRLDSNQRGVSNPTVLQTATFVHSATATYLEAMWGSNPHDGAIIASHLHRLSLYIAWCDISSANENIRSNTTFYLPSKVPTTIIAVTVDFLYKYTTFSSSFKISYKENAITGSVPLLLPYSLSNYACHNHGGG